MEDKVIEMTDDVANKLIENIQKSIDKENNTEVKIWHDPNTDMLKIETENYSFYQNVWDFSINDVIELLQSLGHNTFLKEFNYDE